MLTLSTFGSEAGQSRVQQATAEQECKCFDSFMSNAHYMLYIPRLQVFRGCKTASQDDSYLPRFGVAFTPQTVSSAVVKTSLSFNYGRRFVCSLMTQRRNTHIPPLSLCCCITPKGDQVRTLYTLWTTASVTTAINSSVHARIHLCMPTAPNSKMEISNIFNFL